MHGPRASFNRMDKSTPLDWAIIAGHMIPFVQQLPKRILAHMQLLRGDYGGFAVDRLEHCLQTATRAHQDGRDEEYVVCSLLHDIGDLLGPMNHADIAAALLKPFVSEKNHWLVEHHAIFQGYYFFQYLGLDRNMRDQFKEHPYYEYTLEFCDKYDQNSFDPHFKSMTLDDFEPMLKRVFAKPKHSIYLKQQQD
jgi:predicted HD phosphohydrolase